MHNKNCFTKLKNDHYVFNISGVMLDNDVDPHKDTKISMEIQVNTTMVDETPDTNSFDENYTKSDESYTKMEENYTKMDDKYTKMDDNYAKVDENYSKMDDNYANLDDNYATKDEKYSKIDENYTKMEAGYTKMDEEYTKMDENYTKMEVKEECDVADKNTTDVKIEYRCVTFDVNVSRDVAGSHMTNAKNVIVSNAGLITVNIPTNNLEIVSSGATELNEGLAQIGNSNHDNGYSEHIPDSYQTQTVYPNEMSGLGTVTNGKEVIEVCDSIDEANKEQSINPLQFRCHLCNSSFESRLPSLIHIATKHEPQWLELTNKNKIGNIAEFSQRIDKALAKNIQKRAKTRVNKESAGKRDDFIANLAKNNIEKMWSCSFCPSSFKWPDYHNKHVDIIHRKHKENHKGT